MFLLFLTTLIILISYYSFFSFLKISSLAEKFILAILWASAQVILTELALGTFGWLYPVILASVNIILASTLLIWTKQKNVLVFDALSEDGKRFLKDCIPIIVWRPNMLLLLLFGVVTVWLTFASFLMPPRGVDDLGYHLPAIYQYVITHRIYLLPVELRGFFAYPENAELLFLWPTLFLHNTDFIGLTQFIFTCAGIIVLYALASQLKIPPKFSLFIALQFLFTPVVLAQAGSGYIDNIFAVFYLLSFYFAAQFYREGKPIYLVSAGTALGIFLGMKYSALLMAPIPILILILASRRHSSVNLMPGIAMTALCGSYWYIRNYLILNNPIYPIDPTKPRLGHFDTADPADVSSFFQLLAEKMNLLFKYDVGIDSFHGGFGLTFWGIALIAWVYIFTNSLSERKTDKLYWMIFWGQFLYLFALLFISPIAEFPLNPRYVIAVIPIGLLAVGEILVFFKNHPIYQKILIFACCLFSILAVVRLSSSELPSYSVDAPIEDILKNTYTSETKYLRPSPYMPMLSYAWELLDLMTHDDPAGIDVYMAVDAGFYWTAPTFGSNLQNRIWNFSENPRTPPHAYLYSLEAEYFSGSEQYFYLRKIIPPRLILADPNYELILTAGASYFFIRKDYLLRKMDRLSRFYLTYFSKEIAFLEKTRLPISKNASIFDSSPWGHAMMYLNLFKKTDYPLNLLPGDAPIANILAAKNSREYFYTINRPHAGAHTEEIFKTTSGGGDLIIYKNFTKP